MSIIVNLQISEKPELRADFMSEFGEVVSVTRVIDACNWLYVTTNDETGKIEVVSHWNSREEYDKYLQWRQETSFLGPMFERYMNEDPVWRYLPVFMKFE